jgi:hypothetical protein
MSDVLPETDATGDGRDLRPVIREIVRALRGVNYGSIEVVIHNSRVVQIERKEKIRFDKI